jgi:dephospho-CoA kinase
VTRPAIIGLTGPIGCGKSTVARLLGERGAAVIDADAVAREVSAPGTAGHDEILAAFGGSVRDAGGRLDRRALARLVFADPEQLRRLEAIVHPRVRPAILARIDEAVAAGAPAVAIEAIKLVEGGLAELCDVVVLVDCEPTEQVTRLEGRGMAADDARRRIAAQQGLRERLAAAGAVSLATSGSLADVEARVDALWSERVVPAGRSA